MAGLWRWIVKNKVLEELKAGKGQPVSGEEMSKRLGISRTAVWKHIGKLRNEGYSIESQTNSGYKLTGSPDVMSLSELEPLLKTEFIGKNIIYLDSIDSTNIYAKKKAEDPFREGTVVIADEQTVGRGRLGRNWVSTKGKGIWMTIMLKPDIQPSDAPKLSIVAALAVANALRSCCRVNARIKWPNDIVTGGKKLSGILTEMSAEADEIKYVIIGIGINVNMEIDEYESIRLIDLEGFSQEECAIQMNISRATVQRIYIEARTKLAESLVYGKVLKIRGG